MLFPLRTDYYGPFTGIKLGDTFQRELTREFLIDNIRIYIKGKTKVSTGGITTPARDGLLNILKRVTLNVTDGARTRNAVDLTGPGLMSLNMKVANIDAVTANTILISQTIGAAVDFALTYTIWFRPPHIDDPEASMFLLPVNRYSSNPLLTLYIGASSDIDQAASPTFDLDTGLLTVAIVVNRRQVGVASWPIYDTELIEQNVAYPNSGPNQVFELPTPGAFTGILIRGFNGAPPAQTASYLITANGDYRIQVLGTVLRRLQPVMIQTENDINIGAVQIGNAPYPNVPTTVGETFFDFLDVSQGRTVGDMGSVLDVNALPTAGARAQIIGDIAGGTGSHLNFLWHRIYGDLSPMKAALKLK